MSIHTLTIVKRTKNPLSFVPGSNYLVQTDSKATCSCGWSSDYKPTEQLAREEYSTHERKYYPYSTI